MLVTTRQVISELSGENEAPETQVDLGPRKKGNKTLEMTVCLLKTANGAENEVCEPEVKGMLKEPHIIAEH